MLKIGCNNTLQLNSETMFLFAQYPVIIYVTNVIRKHTGATNRMTEEVNVLFSAKTHL